jgi:hypothetical protein
MAALVLIAAMLASPASAQDSADIEPLTGLPWRVIYAVYGDDAGYRIEYYFQRISDAEMTTAAATVCRRTGKTGKASVRFQQRRERDGRQWSEGTLYMYVRCK